MTMEQGESVRWVGIDVAKAAIDVALGTAGPVHRVERAPDPLRQWAQALPPGTRAVLEATGGYEQVVADVLRAHGVAVSIVNPRQVRDFAKATGQLAKTDRLDARVLAHFGETLRPRVTATKAADVDAVRGPAGPPPPARRDPHGGEESAQDGAGSGARLH
jgi:transposase